MPSNSLKVSFALEADTLEAAIAYLSEHFLNCTKTGCRVVRKKTEARLADLCRLLVEDWQSGKLSYDRGEITLIFSSGELTAEANLLIYNPEQGDRFLYAKRPDPPAAEQSSLFNASETAATSPEPTEQFEASAQSEASAQQLAFVQETLAQLTEHQRSVETRLAALLKRYTIVENTLEVSVAPLQTRINAALNAQTETFTQRLEEVLAAQPQPAPPPTPEALESQNAMFTEQLEAALKNQAIAFSQQLQTALEAQAATFAQTLANQLTATALHFSQRADALQAQMNHLTAQLTNLGSTAAPPPPVQPPRTEAEWLHRFEETWGTVGDYENYSYNYRAANAETPLHHTPDWIALCDLEWARRLSPTLATLYELIYTEAALGEVGADILQQFGRHLDPDTGEPYYIYKIGGFSAYEALWQTVNNPQYSWMPELQQLWDILGDRRSGIFQLFGWEPEAIAALQRIVEQSYRQQKSSTDAWGNYSKNSGDRLRDYLLLLNLSPFTPITVDSIKRAYKQAMKTAHPDAGGSNEQAQHLNEAYEAVLSHYFPDAI